MGGIIIVYVSGVLLEWFSICIVFVIIVIFFLLIVGVVFLISEVFIVEEEEKL